MEKIRFLDTNDAITVQKENGTKVSYFIFDEYEVHLNTILPHSIQEWHYHTQIEETLVIQKGTLTCRWMEDGVEQSRKVTANELVKVGTSIHTFENESEEAVEFLVFRFVSEGKDQRETIKNDKVIVERG